MRNLKFKRLAALPIGAVATAVILCTSLATASNGAQSQSSAAPAAPTVHYTTLQSPAIPGVPALPGPVAKPAQPSATMGVLNVTPDQGVAGDSDHDLRLGLPANASVRAHLVDRSATWLVQPSPTPSTTSAASDTLFAVVLDTTTTDSIGAFNVSLTAPQDLGGMHDIYAVVNGVELAHGGFITLADRHGHPDQRTCGHADHDHLQRPWATACTPAAVPCCGTTTTSAS